MRTLVLRFGIGFAGLLMAAPALAQTAPPPVAVDCNFASFQNNEIGIPGPSVTACGKSVLNQNSAIITANSVRNAVVNRFDTGGNEVNPAGLELSNPEDIANRLTGGNGFLVGFLVAPTADLAAPAAKPRWNVWIDGKYSWLNQSPAASDLDGDVVNLVTGADYKLSDRLVLGAMGSYENSDLKGSGFIPPTQKIHGWGGGAYMGFTLTDNVVFSANVLRASLDTTVNGVTHLNSTRWQSSAGLTGYWYTGTWRYSPSLTFAWSKEWQDAALGFNKQTTETATLSPAFQIGNTIALHGANTVEPWLGAELDWAMRNRVVDKVLGTVLNDPNVDLRLQSGLNFSFGGNAQLALTAEASGLLIKKSDTYTVGANFAYQF